MKNCHSFMEKLLGKKLGFSSYLGYPRNVSLGSKPHDYFMSPKSHPLAPTDFLGIYHSKVL